MMADIKLPAPAYPAGTTGMLGEHTWDRNQMRSHAAAQSAADNAGLRADLDIASNDVLACGKALVAADARIKVLEDALKIATDWLVDDEHPIGWTTERLRAALEATK